MRFRQLLCRLGAVAASSFGRTTVRHAQLITDASIDTIHLPLRYDSNIELSFETNRGPIQLELHPNHDLLQRQKKTTFVLEDEFGDLLREEEVEASQYNIYKGHTLHSNGRSTVRVGDARILVHSTTPLIFEGSFSIDAEMYNIQLGHVYRAMRGPGDHPVNPPDDSMVMWSSGEEVHMMSKRDTDMLWYGSLEQDACSVSHTSEFLKRQLAGDTGSSYQTQTQLAATIGQIAGCPVQREVAILGAAADCNFVSLFNSTASARASIIAAFNSASAVYESTFNISLGLGQIVISEASCPATALSSSPWNTACDSTTTIGDRLSRFSLWRGNQSDTFAAWSLLTTCSTGSEIGVAWLSTVCNANTTNQTDASVSGTNVIAASASGGSYWRTLAHELGHNFGAVHDCTSDTCGTSTDCCPLSASTCPANGAYLMNPATSPSATGFSPCTVGQICSNMLNKRITTSCLTSNQNVHLADGANSCGNGIVEEGEECDCGGTAGCGTNSCCNPTTCKFNAGAVCDSQVSQCCTDQCQFAAANTTCRVSTGECDPAEMCSGTSGICPTDSFAPNGQTCGSGLQCASGQCTSRALQCQQQMNGSHAPCDNTECALTCYIGNDCFIASQYFITGTPCGTGGYCNTGTCDEGSFGHQVETWFEKNRKWLIPVVAVVGGLILLTIAWSLIAGCIQSRKRKKAVPEMVYSYQGDYTAPQYPTHIHQRDYR